MRTFAMDPDQGHIINSWGPTLATHQSGTENQVGGPISIAQTEYAQAAAIAKYTDPIPAGKSRSVLKH